MNRLSCIKIVAIFFAQFTVEAQGMPIPESVCNTTGDFLTVRIDANSNRVVEGEEGHGGPDPLYFDTWAGVWVDPVSGLLVDDGNDFGLTLDTETGAKFYKPRGLWVNPDTLLPVPSTRLNSFPYYDPNTNQSIDLTTGLRTPYPETLFTIGANRKAAYNVRYACLGDNLRMRIDPASGQYLSSMAGIPTDDTLFDTLDAMIDGRPISRLVGDRYVPPGFVAFRHFDTTFLRDDLGLINGMTRADAIKVIYTKFAPESPEGGIFDLREARIEGGIITQITARGLLDDAVLAVQILLFFDTSMNGRDRLVNVGVRQKCGRPNSSEAWTRDRC